MGSDPEELGNALKGAGGFQDHAALFIVIEPFGQIAQQERRAFDAGHADGLESGSGQLRAQLARPVRVAAERPGSSGGM
jgi:hypothetical protein